MTLIDLLKVTDLDTRVAVEIPGERFPIAGKCQEVLDELTPEMLESNIVDVYLSIVYSAIYITIE